MYLEAGTQNSESADLPFIYNAFRAYLKTDWQIWTPPKSKGEILFCKKEIVLMLFFRLTGKGLLTGKKISFGKKKRC